MNRVHVHAFNVERNSLMNRNDKSSSILFLMKKNRQFFSNSETANKMNIENDFIRDENFENIASHAYVNLAVKTRILSTKNLCLQYKRKLFMHDSIQDHSRSKSSTKNSRKRFISLSKKQRILFRKKRLRKSL